MQMLLGPDQRRFVAESGGKPVVPILTASLRMVRLPYSASSWRGSASGTHLPQSLRAFVALGLRLVLTTAVVRLSGKLQFERAVPDPELLRE